MRRSASLCKPSPWRHHLATRSAKPARCSLTVGSRSHLDCHGARSPPGAPAPHPHTHMHTHSRGLSTRRLTLHARHNKTDEVVSTIQAAFQLEPRYKSPRYTRRRVSTCALCTRLSQDQLTRLLKFALSDVLPNEKERAQEVFELAGPLLSEEALDELEQLLQPSQTSPTPEVSHMTPAPVPMQQTAQSVPESQVRTGRAYLVPGA